MRERPEIKLRGLYDVLGKLPPSKRPNLAILTENEFLFSYKDRLSHATFLPDSGPVTRLRLDRGIMMDFFAQLEAIVNQVFVARFALAGTDIHEFEQLLDAIDFFSKIRFLNDWRLIDNKMKEKLICLKEVRNGFAHHWDIRAVRYKNSQLSSNFERFKKDALDAFQVILRLYNGGEVDISLLLENLTKDLP